MDSTDLVQSLTLVFCENNNKLCQWRKERAFLTVRWTCYFTHQLHRRFYITHIKTDNTENVSHILHEHHQELVSSQTNVI